MSFTPKQWSFRSMVDSGISVTSDTQDGGLWFLDRDPGDKGYIIPDASLIAKVKRGNQYYMEMLEEYYGSSRMLYCVRVGFWDKPSGVDPMEYIESLSGVTKVGRAVAKHCFDVGFVSAKKADDAIEKRLFFKGAMVPHFRACSSNEIFSIIHFASLPTSL
ncbi:hypothetical protein DSO57_1039554 [Entomophthora muscae]|uniref:Uncharacterized protein n=1 Tax=Entomophthora muscae TaxID=34485 RepID=A0ACC2RP77_9FUNG|nr:hypothetical protein DSO57_1039554 [Entomophthora muscae]